MHILCWSECACLFVANAKCVALINLAHALSARLQYSTYARLARKQKKIKREKKAKNEENDVAIKNSAKTFDSLAAGSIALQRIAHLHTMCAPARSLEMCGEM